jgi:Brp/Blh family beta-carotene 15,15'-monooxygenase
MAQRLTDHAEPAARPLPAGRAQIHTWLTYPVWNLLLAVLLFSLLFPAAALRWQFAPFLVGMVFLGLPHGALDHLAPLFIRHRNLTPRYLVLFVLGYLACVGLYLLFWHFAPAAALVVFLLFSWLHWGQGDAYFQRIFEDRPPARNRSEELVRWLVRGGLPIFLPALAFPSAFARVASGILGWYGQAGTISLGESWRIAGIALLALLICAYLWLSWSGKRQGFWRDAWEVALLLVFFLLASPILAVGVYFCVWHSARHLARLMLLDDANRLPLTLGDLAKPLLRTAWEAIPMTIGALLLLAGLFWWTGRSVITPEALVYLYLSLIAALTFPHFLLVLWMDREEFNQDSPHPIRVGGRGS